MFRRLLPALVALALLVAPGALAQTEIVENRVFETANFTTRGGGTIPQLRIDYQTAGTLNAAGDNAVLVGHFFSGNSHAFGRYAEGQPPGY